MFEPSDNVVPDKLQMFLFALVVRGIINGSWRRLEEKRREKVEKIKMKLVAAFDKYISQYEKYIL